MGQEVCVVRSNIMVQHHFTCVIALLNVINNWIWHVSAMGYCTSQSRQTTDVILFPVTLPKGTKLYMLHGYTPYLDQICFLISSICCCMSLLMLQLLFYLSISLHCSCTVSELHSDFSKVHKWPVTKCNQAWPEDRKLADKTTFPVACWSSNQDLLVTDNTHKDSLLLIVYFSFF